jgi:hypothetical protein
MTSRVVGKESLANLPKAIWLALGPKELLIYRGEPLEILHGIACGMGLNVSVREAIETLSEAILEKRRVSIEMPDGITDEALAKLFIFALIDTGIGKPLAQA